MKKMKNASCFVQVIHRVLFNREIIKDKIWYVISNVHKYDI